MLDVLPKLTERLWQRQLVGEHGLARLFGWRHWHDRATNFPRACPHCKRPLRLPRNDPGWPDLFLIRDDTLVIAELKSSRGKLTEPQRDWLEAFRKVRRIKVAVWRPQDLDEIVKELR